MERAQISEGPWPPILPIFAAHDISVTMGGVLVWSSDITIS